jgi:4,5-dihydroxyphthalate decarboxylase
LPNSPPLRLTTVLRRFGHTADLKDGKIPLADVRLDFVEVGPAIAAYRRMVRDVEFDMCELAPTTYCIARAYGAPFKALPIFLTRQFHHEGLIVHADRDIRTPKDLEGKKVGVRASSVTTGVWTRGILENECGVDPAKVTWVVDDEEHVTQLRLPPNVMQAPLGRSLAQMMAAGEIDAAFTGNAGIGREGAPQAGWETRERPPTGADAELWPDGRALGFEWFRRTGIYPFHGVIVLKEALLAAHPRLAKTVFEAFSEAKARWLQRLRSGEADSADDRKYRALIPVVGADPLPYGIKANLPSIEALVTYAVQQKLMPRRLSVEELFVDPEAESDRKRRPRWQSQPQPTTRS